MDNQNIVGRVLCIDFGSRRMGVAISDPLRISAQMLPTIKIQSTQQVLDDLNKIVDKKSVSEIVVGMPFHLKGERGETAQQVEKFIRKLKARFKIPIKSWDERFSSIAAERSIREMGKSPSRNKEKIDQISAQIILQSYLDYIKART